jgi:putative DNA primase/helicase
MIALARSEPGIAVGPADLDADPWLLNVRNGTIDLRTGDLRPHQPADLITKLAPVDYDADAPCPQWEKFEREVFAGNGAMVDYVRRIFGQATTGDVSVQELYIFHGDGANGKSVYLDTVRGILGDYATKAESSLLLAKRQQDHPTGLADLDGKRFVMASETGDGRSLAETLVKSLTGDATIKARLMRQDFYEFKRTFKIVLATNHRPEIKGGDLGIWRRIRLVPFGVTFVDDPEDVHEPDRLLKVEGLGDRLACEAPGILAALVRAVADWRENGMGPPKEVLAATDDYRKQMDVVGEFVADQCVASVGNNEIKTKASALYGAYATWCEDSGIKRDRVLCMRDFGQELDKRGHVAKHEKTGNYRLGIGLRDFTHAGYGA